MMSVDIGDIGNIYILYYNMLLVTRAVLTDDSLVSDILHNAYYVTYVYP